MNTTTVKTNRQMVEKVINNIKNNDKLKNLPIHQNEVSTDAGLTRFELVDRCSIGLSRSIARATYEQTNGETSRSIVFWNDGFMKENEGSVSCLRIPVSMNGIIKPFKKDPVFELKVGEVYCFPILVIKDNKTSIELFNIEGI